VLSERYRIIKKVGEGGMGAVYLAEHVFIEKKVALKILAPELARKPELTARFLQEAKSASRIGHENVIDISDFGQSPEGLVFFAMEYLEGSDLSKAIRDGGPMPWTRAQPVLMQICRALRVAHEKGIVHRDMKPENVFLIRKEDREDFVKILDFGIAKVQSVGGEDTPKLTQTGMIFGTPEYMAPEQAEGRVCDSRADIYSVGCIMYHLVTGDPPFKAENFMAMLTKHLLEEPVKPSLRRADLRIAPEVDAIVLKALVKNRDNRFQSMDELIAAIEAVPFAAPARTATPAPPRPATQTIPRGAQTKQIGGADVMPVVTSTPRVSNTQMVGPAGTESDLEPPPVRRPAAGRTGLVVGLGVAVVLAAVAGVVMMKGKGAPPPEASIPAVATPEPAPPAGAEKPAVDPAVDPGVTGAAGAATLNASPGVVPAVNQATEEKAGERPMRAEGDPDGRRRRDTRPRRISPSEDPPSGETRRAQDSQDPPDRKKPKDTPAELKTFGE
jgi:serine/threonine-protein kinase